MIRTLVSGALLLNCAGALAVDAPMVVTQPLPGRPGFTLGVARLPEAVSWSDARDLAQASGAQLFTPAATLEVTAVADLAVELGPWECTGPWLGGKRAPALASLDSGWTDVTGVELQVTHWSVDQPMGSSSLHWKAAIDGRDPGLLGWVNLLPDPDAGPAVHGYVFTVSSSAPDCDLDGISDLIEIVVLGAADLDEDGVPDCCGIDLDGDGSVGGADLAFLLGRWGACPDVDDCPGDFNGDGMINGYDLTLLLAHWDI
ncbi:MAG: hypothetical protein P8J45_03230 [Phycisphaerales bacterium]|nr:hypothetical protein [Phycisphaerales bacterium]